MIDKAFVGGADKNCEWLLPWWLGNIRKNSSIPVIIYDFGLSKKGKDWAHRNNINLLTLEHNNGWFMKPSAILDAPAKQRIWLDIDCEVKKPIDDIFSFIEEERIAVAPDPVHSWGCKYNSGVVGVQDKPAAVKEWKRMCDNPKQYGQMGRGDQELLWEMIKEDKNPPLSHIPKQYCWLRIYLEKYKKYHKDVRIIHWTGPRGKEIIAKSVRNKISTLQVLQNKG
jgi:hypothetical protein